MKKLLSIMIVAGCVSCARKDIDITGRWKGYYTTDTEVPQEKRFKDTTSLIIEITQHDRTTFSCKTYTQGKVFYAETAGEAKIDNERGVVTITEKKIQNQRMDTGLSLCLSAYTLEFKHTRNGAALTGKAESWYSTNGNNCGNGTVYLQKEK